MNPASANQETNSVKEGTDAGQPGPYFIRSGLVIRPGGTMPLRVFFPILLTGCLLAACSLPAPTVPPTPGADAYAATVAALQTSAVNTASAQGFGPASTPTPPSTIAMPQTGGGQNPAVIRDTLCWRGPGPEYEVIGTIHAGTSVSMLGRGVISGWFVIRNPVSGDPCWLEASNLQIPASVDLPALPVYNPPWTPTPTPPPAMQATATP